MNTPFRKKASCLAVSAAITLLLLSSGAEARVCPCVFEMDGNPQWDNPSAPTGWSGAWEPEDWEKPYRTWILPPTTPPWTSKAKIYKLVTDMEGLPGFPPPGVTKDVIMGSGCKDVNDLTACEPANHAVPDKDDYENGSFAAYVLPPNFNSGNPLQAVDHNGVAIQGVFHTPGDLVIVMQGDLYAANGDAALGGWIFKNHVTMPAVGQKFATPRTVGDIFIEADFTNGGREVSFGAFAWVGSGGDTAGTLQKIFYGPNMRCDSTAATLGCAITNHGGAVPTIWPYLAKGDRAATPPSTWSTEYPATSFFEGILNLSAILRMQQMPLGCYSDFMYETRSSHSETAQLKDVILGSAPLCGLKVDKSGDTLSKVGDEVDYSIRIENNGVVPLYKQSINDSLLGDLTGNTGCGAVLNPGATCYITTKRTVLETDADPLPNTVTAVYDSASNLAGDEISKQSSWKVDLFVPVVNVTKVPNKTISMKGDAVTYTYTITNNSHWKTPGATHAASIPNLELDTGRGGISDDKISLPVIPGACSSLATGASCSFTANHAFSSDVEGDVLTNTVIARYKPVGFPNQVDANAQATVKLFRPKVEVEKTGPELVKRGDTFNYNFTIRNVSTSASLTDAEIPALVQDATNGIVDTPLLGNLTNSDPAACNTLAKGASCSFSVPKTIPGSYTDTNVDPISNTVAVLYHAQGFPLGAAWNAFTHSESHTAKLFRPDFTLTKTCEPARVKVGDPLTYTYTLNNTSTASAGATPPDLKLQSVTDSKVSPSFPATLANGATNVTVTAQYTPWVAGTVRNDVSATYAPQGFLDNTVTKTAYAECTAYVGDQGCTPGFWKTHPEYWDGVGSDDKTATIKWQQSFNTAFGVTQAYSGLANSVTLMDAANLGGGGLMALNRHAAAGLASADAVNYPYSVSGLITLYRDAVGFPVDPGNWTVSTALKAVSDANELRCPF